MFHEDEHETFPSVHYYVTGGFLTLFGLLARVNEVKLSKGGIIQRIFKHCISTAFLHLKKILWHFLS